jgi:hypothetical protein
MRNPSSIDLLAAWERGLGRPAAVRALLLLSAAEPSGDWEALTALGIGERDAGLLELRQALFGSTMQCVARCETCTEQLEFSVEAHDVGAMPAAAGHRESMEIDGVAVSFRLPVNADMLDLESGQSVADGERLLLSRCMLDAHDGHGCLSADALPETVRAAVTRRMAELDPAADVQIGMHCPACGAKWTAPFDIAAFLWDEVDRWARSALRDVHALARAYGWREADILGMTAARRRMYLDMLDG